MINIPLANPSRELEYISNFKKFDQQIRGGVYVGGDNVKVLKIISNILSLKYCVSLNSGTDALIFALVALGIKKEIKYLFPLLLFFQLWNALCNLMQLIFVDINLQNYTIDLDDFRKKATSQIKAAIPVHLFGNDSQITD